MKKNKKRQPKLSKKRLDPELRHVNVRNRTHGNKKNKQRYKKRLFDDDCREGVLFFP